MYCLLVIPLISEGSVFKEVFREQKISLKPSHDNQVPLKKENSTTLEIFNKIKEEYPLSDGAKEIGIYINKGTFASEK